MNKHLHSFDELVGAFAEAVRADLGAGAFQSRSGGGGLSGLEQTSRFHCCISQPVAPCSLAHWPRYRRGDREVLSALSLTALNPRTPGLGHLSITATWNFIVIAGVFALIAVLISEITRLLERERMLARTDVLTGARNRLAFMADVDQEILRSLRHGQSLSLIYIDLDNFKSVN